MATDSVTSLISAAVVKVSDNDFRSFLRKRFRRMFADPLPAAGDNDNFPLKHDLPPKMSYSHMQRISQSRNGFNVAMLHATVILNEVKDLGLS